MFFMHYYVGESWRIVNFEKNKKQKTGINFHIKYNFYRVLCLSVQADH